MATYNYYLRKPNATIETPIVLFISINGKITKISTGETINPKYWDKKKQLAKPSHPGSQELNAFLLAFKGKAHAEHREFKVDHIQPSTHQLRKAVAIPKAKSSSEFEEAMKKFIESREKTFQRTTIQKYYSVDNHLKSYQAEKNRHLTFDSIDVEFMQDFSDYLLQSKKHNNNTVCKYIKTLKTFMQWSLDRNLHSSNDFRKFKVKEYPIEIVYLTLDEVLRLINMDLSHDRALERTRDAFCFGCVTGQRYSDIFNLDWSDIKNGTWYLRTKKTKDMIEIPLNNYALDILKKYKGKLKPIEPLANQKMNDNLKIIAEDADINDVCKIIRYKGNRRVEETAFKYDLITTHTARRTFVTLSLEKGMRPETVMEITGHKDYKTLKRYIKITSKVKELEMKKVWNNAA